MATLTVQIDANLLKRVQEIAAQRGLSVERFALESIEEKAAPAPGLRSFYDDTTTVEMGKTPLRSQIYR